MKSSDIFDCKKCGECCKGYGGTYITAEDIKAIAAYISAEPESDKYFKKISCQMPMAFYR